MSRTIAKPFTVLSNKKFGPQKPFSGPRVEKGRPPYIRNPDGLVTTSDPHGPGAHLHRSPAGIDIVGASGPEQGVDVDPFSLGVTTTYWDRVAGQGLKYAFVLIRRPGRLPVTAPIMIDYLIQGQKAKLKMAVYWILEPNIDGAKQADEFIDVLTTPLRGGVVIPDLTKTTPISIVGVQRPALWVVKQGDTAKIAATIEAFTRRLKEANLFVNNEPYLATTSEMAAHLASISEGITRLPLWLLNPHKEPDGTFNVPLGWKRADLIEVSREQFIAGEKVGLSSAEIALPKGSRSGIPGVKAGSLGLLALLVGGAYLLSKTSGSRNDDRTVRLDIRAR